MAKDAQERIDSYLAELRRGLRGLGEANVSEIEKELRSHILERATVHGELTEAGVIAALAGLGAPELLAREYSTDELLTRLEGSRSPLRMLDGLFRWASLSLAGVFALLGSLAGYAFGLLCMLLALLKPLHPQTVGLWKFLDKTGDVEFSLRLGFSPAPQNGQELLSWWIVPIGLASGFICLLLTTSFARWCVRQFRRGKAPLRSI